MKKYLRFSNIIFIIAISIFFYGVYKIYSIKKILPVGVCPIEDNRPILYLGIFFMVLSIVLSYIEDIKLKKKNIK